MRGNNPFNAATPPPSLPHTLGPVQPMIMQRGVHKPVVGQFLVVDVPGSSGVAEKNRAEIIEVFGENIAVVRLGMMTLSGKAHHFVAKQEVAVKRDIGDMGEVWRVIDEREMRALDEAERLAEEAFAQEQAKRDAALGLPAAEEAAPKPALRRAKRQPRTR